jgi:hypothetical protein
MIRFSQYITEAEEGLKNKAEKSGMPLGILRKVYNRGVAAWKTGHRPGTTPQQWGFARVNSFVTKSSGTWGKADKDLASRVRKEDASDNSAARKPEKYTGPDGKVRIRMVPVKKEIIKKDNAKHGEEL